MPTSIATPRVAVRTEFHYREHPLIVSRGCPVPRGSDADAQRDQLRAHLPPRHGRMAHPVGTVRRRDSRRNSPGPALQSHRRPLARPCRRTARGVLLRLPGRRPPRQRPSLRSQDHPDRPGRAGAFVRPAVGRRRQPAAPQLDDRVDDRPPAHASIRARPWKTPSSTSCTCAATRSTPARA